MNYMQIENASVANGKGIRTVLWVSGCSLHCKGCQNPESWDFKAGQLFDEKAKQRLFECLSNPYIQGLTISGGHPLDDKNLEEVLSVVEDAKTFYPDKDIWIYTGLNLTYEDFIYAQPNHRTHYDILRYNILNLSDVVVDGEYIEKMRDTTLPFRGSSNQRLIDVKQTINNKKIILFKI